MDITTEVGPEDDHSLTNTKYFVYKVMDSASTKFRKSINASSMVQMPAFISILNFNSNFNIHIEENAYIITFQTVRLIYIEYIQLSVPHPLVIFVQSHNFQS